MATGALGSVSNRLRHENGDTHVVICDDVFSDAGSTPAASTKKMPGPCPGYFFGEAPMLCSASQAFGLP